jgi:ferredoxin--NADP+ reductase
MFKIIHKEVLAKGIKKIDVEAPHIARKAKPGQFVILRVSERGERIPLTVADKDPAEGIITLIFQEVGKTTYELGTLTEGKMLLDLIGPLGKPTEVENYGVVVCIGGGVGIAEVCPVAEIFKEKGNKVIGIIGAREKSLLILEEKMRFASDRLYITTDDGSYGEKGFVSDVLKRLIKESTKIDLVYTIGPVPMMRVVSEVTRPARIKTIVSLNPVMVDGTGMCGACRVTVGGEMKFACVDGPEFDGHLVDFQELMARLALFKDFEKVSMQKCINCGQ